MKYTLLYGGVERELDQKEAEKLLNTEGLLFQVRKAKDQSFADVFGIIDKSLKHNCKLKFVDFQPNEDISIGDVLFAPSVGELRVTKVELQFYEGKPYLLRAYVSYPLTIVSPSEE